MLLHGWQTKHYTALESGMIVVAPFQVHTLGYEWHLSLHTSSTTAAAATTTTRTTPTGTTTTAIQHVDRVQDGTLTGASRCIINVVIFLEQLCP